MDDLPDTIEPLVRLVTLRGHQATTTLTESAALEVLDAKHVDLAILDVDLLDGVQIERIKEAQRLTGGNDSVPEEKAGYRVAGVIRRNFPDVGVIMFSSQKIRAADQIDGLMQGADDYIIKTDDLGVALARVEAVLRRRRLEYGEIAVFDDLQLHLRTRRLVLGNDEIPLTDAEFRVLEFLVVRRNQNHDREELYRVAFSSEMPSEFDRAVDTLISKVRRKLYGPSSHGHIETVRGEGYRFTAAVRML